MRIAEIQSIKPIKPKTPGQQRIVSLQTQAKKAQDAVKTERERQKIAKAQQNLVTLRNVTA